jgi:hypothetical protein
MAHQRQQQQCRHHAKREGARDTFTRYISQHLCIYPFAHQLNESITQHAQLTFATTPLP